MAHTCIQYSKKHLQSKGALSLEALVSVEKVQFMGVLYNCKCFNGMHTILTSTCFFLCKLCVVYLVKKAGLFTC